MNGLAPADAEGNYLRPPSDKQIAKLVDEKTLMNRPQDQLPTLIVGRSCPWAHRAWLVYELKGLHQFLNLRKAKPDLKGGRWKLDPPFMKSSSLLTIYKKCGSPPSHRATVPALIDPGDNNTSATLLGNESAQLVETLNRWPNKNKNIDLAPSQHLKEIESWQNIFQDSLNNGVYKCGFARNQNAYDKASNELFESLNILENSLSKKGPWLCGDDLTIADIRIFPTLIRWESIYEPLFRCGKEPLWTFPHIWEWRKRLLSFPDVLKTCNSRLWRNDYYGALFPLQPSNIVPNGPHLEQIVNARIPISS